LAEKTRGSSLSLHAAIPLLLAPITVSLAPIDVSLAPITVSLAPITVSLAPIAVSHSHATASVTFFLVLSRRRSKSRMSSADASVSP